MFIICDRDALDDAVSPALHATSSKSTIPALEGILITAEKESNTLVICGYDMEKGVRVTLSGEDVQVIESGAIVINAARFSAVVRNLPSGDATIKTDENLIVSVNSKTGKSEFTMHGLSGDVYPLLPELKGGTTFKISRGELKSMILTTNFAVTNDSSSPSLNGALFEIQENCISIIGTDRYRIALRRNFSSVEYSSSPPPDLRFVVPGKSLSELVKLIGDSDDFCEIELTRKHVIVFFENIVFFSRLIENEFIDYRRVMTLQPSLTAVVGAKEFAESVGRVAILTEDRQKSIIKLKFAAKDVVSGETDALHEGWIDENGERNGNGDESESESESGGNEKANGVIQMTSVTTLGKTYDECNIIMDGEPMEIGFNHRYLIDALKACKDEKVILKLESPYKSMIILPYYADENEDGDAETRGEGESGGEEFSGGTPGLNADVNGEISEEINRARFVHFVLPIRMRE